MSVTENLNIDGFGKCGEHMVRGTFEFLFGDYMTHLEVIGASDWIGVKIVLKMEGVTYEFLIEVKTSRITHRNNTANKMSRKETDIARDDSGMPIVSAGGAMLHDCLNLVMEHVDYYRTQRTEGAILVNLIVFDDCMRRYRKRSD